MLLSNAAKHFEHTVDIGGMGWRSWNAGYLSEEARVTATAMFAALHRYELDAAYEALKPHLRKSLKKAAKVIANEHCDFSTSLEQVDLLDWNFAKDRV